MKKPSTDSHRLPNLLLPEMNPVVEDGVGGATSRKHVYCFEDTHKDRTDTRSDKLGHA